MKINWKNQNQVLEIGKHQYKILKEAITKRELTNEEFELMVSIDLYKSKLLTYEDLRNKIKSYCGY